jgi:hypothetical protein
VGPLPLDELLELLAEDVGHGCLLSTRCSTAMDAPRVPIDASPRAIRQRLATLWTAALAPVRVPSGSVWRRVFPAYTATTNQARKART